MKTWIHKHYLTIMACVAIVIGLLIFACGMWVESRNAANPSTCLCIQALGGIIAFYFLLRLDYYMLLDAEASAWHAHCQDPNNRDKVSRWLDAKHRLKHRGCSHH